MRLSHQRPIMLTQTLSIVQPLRLDQLERRALEYDLAAVGQPVPEPQQIGGDHSLRLRGRKL